MPGVSVILYGLTNITSSRNVGAELALINGECDAEGITMSNNSGQTIKKFKELWNNDKGMVQSIASVFHAPSAVRPKVDYEIPRKIFHMAGVLVPLIYWFGGLERSLTITLLIPVVVAMAGSDMLRQFTPEFNNWYMKKFGRLMRRSEKQGLTTSTYFMTATLFVVAAFPKHIAVLSILFLSLGDPAAAMIGRRFGEVKIWGKSLEGFLGCFQVCFLVALPFVPPHLAGIGAFAAATAELLPLPVNDNIRIPIISAIVLLAAGA